MNRFEIFQYQKIIKRENCKIPAHKGYKCVPMRSDVQCQQCEEEDQRGQLPKGVDE